MRYFLNVMELTFILILSSTALAAPTVLTYQGRILKADGTPLESKNVSFIFQLTNPSGSCVIYQEQITGYSMVNSGGVFDVPIGNGTINYPLSGGVTVLDVFNNSGSFSCGECTGYNCVDAAGGIYNPQSSDGRLLRVQFHDGSGWKLISPDAVIRSVPYAGYALSAQKLGTNVINDFLLKNDVNNSGSGSSSCDSGNFLTWNATTQKFGCAGVTGSSGGTVKTVTSSSAPYLAVSADTVNPAITLNVGSVTGTVAAGDDARLSDARTPKGSAGGVLTGTYPNPGLADNAVTTLKIADSAVSTPKLFANPGINRLIGTDSSTGATLAPVVCAANQILSWNVATGWQCTDQSSLAVGTATTATNFSGNLVGDVSGTQGVTHVDKLKGYSLNFSSAPSNGQVLKFNGTDWAPANDNSTGKASSSGWSSNSVMVTDGSGAMSALSGSVGSILQDTASGPAWTSSSADLFSQYALLAGRAGGQSLNGGTASGENLTLDSTANSSKGNIILAPTGGYVGIGITGPTSPLHVIGDVRTSTQYIISGVGSMNNAVYGGGLNLGTGGGLPVSISTMAAERMRIDMNGNVGIGTTSPNILASTGRVLTLSGDITANTSPAVLEVRGRAITASTPYSKIDFINFASTGTDINTARIEIATTSGSTTQANMRFYTKDGMGLAERMRIDESGNVGIGTTVPSAFTGWTTLDVKSPAAGNGGGYRATNAVGDQAMLQVASDGSVAIGSSFLVAGSPSPNNATAPINFWAGNSIRQTILANGNVGIGIGAPTALLHVNGSALATAWNVSSDRRLKENIKVIDSPLNKILSLHGVEFDWRKDIATPTQHDQTHDIGVIAQDVEKVFPEAVTNPTEGGFKSVAYSKLVAPLIEAVRSLYEDGVSQKKEMGALKSENQKLKEQILDLSARLEKLEQNSDHSAPSFCKAK